MEIENVVKYMEACKYDESNEQYSDAFSHIAQTTNAYIALALNRNYENVNFNYYFTLLVLFVSYLVDYFYYT